MDVAIAPQISKARQGTVQLVESNIHDDSLPQAYSDIDVGGLFIVPDGRRLTLGELQLLHGDKIRVAVGHDISFSMITGSHARV
jgi:hypothetical protein